MKNVPHMHSTVSVFVHLWHRLHNEPYCCGTSDEKKKKNEKKINVSTHFHILFWFSCMPSLLLRSCSISFHPARLKRSLVRRKHINKRRCVKNYVGEWKTFCVWIYFWTAANDFSFINIGWTVSRRSFVALIAIR